MNKLEKTIKSNSFIQKMYRVFFSLLFKFLSIFYPIKQNLILISSFSGKKYNDSPKTIYDAILKKFGPKHFRIVWAFEDPKLFEKYKLETVKINSFKYFRIAFSAKYWITNVNIERGLSFKKKGQIYLNTWHGSGPKTVGNAVSGRKDYDFSKVDYLCSDGDYLKNIFVKDFNANPEHVLLCGRPREDILYHPDATKIIETRLKYNINENDFVVLYAPTWRETKKQQDNFAFETFLDIKKIFNVFPNCKILYRAHSLASDNDAKSLFSNRFISATEEQEISSLFLISNVLITDYSSANVDFSILNKPFICYAPDYDTYIKSRSLYYDLVEEYPFGVQRTTDEVIEILKEIVCGNNKIDKFVKFKMKYGPFGGDATRVCLQKLFDELPKQE